MKVESLQALSSKVTSKIKANKFIPLTQFIGIKTRAGKLMLSATDGSNHICGEIDTELEEGVDISVSSELFTKLVNALSPQMDVSLKLEDNNLIIFNSAVNYHIPAISDDSGLIKYPEISKPVNATEFDLKKFVECYKMVQNSVDAQSLLPYLASIYVSDVMLGTNNHLLAKADCGDLFGQPVLLPLPLCEVIMQLTGDKVSMCIEEGYVHLFDNTTIIKGRLHEGLAQYPVENIKNLFALSVNSYIKVNSSNLSSALDRVTLFVNDFDDNSVDLTLTDDKLSLASISKSGYEEIGVEGKEGENENITCRIDPRLLDRLLKSFNTPSINTTISEKKIIASSDKIVVICAAKVKQ